MKKATYILDMKMTREKQRNSLTQDLNEMINNPSTSEEARNSHLYPYFFHFELVHML